MCLVNNCVCRCLPLDCTHEGQCDTPNKKIKFNLIINQNYSLFNNIFITSQSYRICIFSNTTKGKINTSRFRLQNQVCYLHWCFLCFDTSRGNPAFWSHEDQNIWKLYLELQRIKHPITDEWNNRGMVLTGEKAVLRRKHPLVRRCPLHIPRALNWDQTPNFYDERLATDNLSNGKGHKLVTLKTALFI